jgi:hypothetical protein
MADSKYDVQKARQVLEESRWLSFQSSDPALLNDGEVVRVIRNIDRKWMDDCIQYLEEYTSTLNAKAQHSVTDPLIDNRPRRGLWRCVDVIAREEWSEKDREMQVNIYQTLKEGWAKAIEYTTGVLLEENNMPSNTEGSGTWASDTPATRFAKIMLPAVDPDVVETLAATLGATTTLTNQKIGRRTYSGAWHIIYAKPRLDSEDHSGWIELFLAQPQLTLEGFEDAGTPDERTNTYALRVPEAVAQTVLDGWKTANPTGSSARYMGHADEGLVNLVLSKSSATAETLNLTGLRAACDTIIDIYFAWGYTSAEIDAFYSLHGGSTAAGVSVEFPRPVRRSDGLFDAMVIVTTKTASVVTITVTVGEKITRAITAAWNVDKATVSAASSTYGQAKRGDIGEFTVTRNNENCTYDYVGVLTTRTDDTGTITFGGVGVEEEVERHTGVDPAGTFTSVGTTDGESYQDELQPEDDGLWARIKRKITRKAMASASAVAGDYRAKQAVVVGQIKKSDAADIGNTSITEGISHEVMGLQLAEDGMLQYIKVTTTEEAHSGAVTGGEQYAADVATVGVIGESSVATLNETPAVGKSTSFPFLQVARNGMITYIKRVLTKTALRKDDLKAGRYLFTETHKQGINTAPGDIPASAALTKGQRRELRTDLNDLGQAEYKVVDVAAVEQIDGPKFAGNEIGTTIKRYLTVARNATALPTCGANDRLRFEITDDGLYDYIVQSLVSTGDVSFVGRRSSKYELRTLATEHSRNGSTTIEVYSIWRELFRNVIETLTVTFSLTKMDADPTTGTGSSSGYTEQESIVDQISENVWVKRTLTVSKGPWERGQYMIDSLYQYPKNTDS